MGGGIFINILVPKEGVVAGDGLEPPSPTQLQGAFSLSWMVETQAEEKWESVFFFWSRRGKNGIKTQ